MPEIDFKWPKRTASSAEQRLVFGVADRIEGIEKAARSQKLLEIHYTKKNNEKKHYRIEPYSTEFQWSDGKFRLMLYAFDVAENKTKTFRVAWIDQVVVTDEAFSSRWAIEI